MLSVTLALLFKTIVIVILKFAAAVAFGQKLVSPQERSAKVGKSNKRTALKLKSLINSVANCKEWQTLEFKEAKLISNGYCRMRKEQSKWVKMPCKKKRKEKIMKPQNRQTGRTEITINKYKFQAQT